MPANSSGGNRQCSRGRFGRPECARRARRKTQSGRDRSLLGGGIPIDPGAAPRSGRTRSGGSTSPAPSYGRPPGGIGWHFASGAVICRGRARSRGLDAVRDSRIYETGRRGVARRRKLFGTRSKRCPYSRSPAVGGTEPATPTGAPPATGPRSTRTEGSLSANPARPPLRRCTQSSPTCRRLRARPVRSSARARQPAAAWPSRNNHGRPSRPRTGDPDTETHATPTFADTGESLGIGPAGRSRFLTSTPRSAALGRPFVHRARSTRSWLRAPGRQCPHEEPPAGRPDAFRATSAAFRSRESREVGWNVQPGSDHNPGHSRGPVVRPSGLRPEASVSPVVAAEECSPTGRRASRPKRESRLRQQRSRPPPPSGAFAKRSGHGPTGHEARNLTTLRVPLVVDSVGAHLGAVVLAPFGSRRRRSAGELFLATRDVNGPRGHRTAAPWTLCQLPPMRPRKFRKPGTGSTRYATLRHSPDRASSERDCGTSRRSNSGTGRPDRVSGLGIFSNALVPC